MDTIRILACAALGFGLAYAEPRAAAQTTEAVAESLFRDGKRLFQAEDYEHACPKLGQSYQIDPAGGTALLLAICYEKQGKFASSWARYSDALAVARRDQREDRERRAREGLDSVEPKLSYVELKIDAATQAIAGVRLAIDGVELPAISDTRLPIDPGKHKLTVRAPNYETWFAEISVGGPSVTESMIVPALQAKSVAPEPAILQQPANASPSAPDNSALAHERASNKNIRTTAYVLGTAGLVAVGVGSYFGFHALKLRNDANTTCPLKECTDSAAVSKSQDALSNAHLADAFVGIGAAVTVSAAVLWYAYRNDPTLSAPYASIAPNAVSLGWRQSF